MERRGFDVLTNILKSVGVQNVLNDSDDDNDDNSDSCHTVNWIQQVISGAHAREINPSLSESPPKKRRKRTWTCRKKLPYSTSMFYRDYHNPNCRILTNIDAKEFRVNYRMPWTEADKIVRKFVVKKWVVTQEECDRRRVKGQRVCPPEIKILGTLYWLGEGCSFRTIYNLSGRVLSALSFLNFAKKFCLCYAKHLSSKYIKIPRDVAELRKVSAACEERGFPGACGSTDGVQIAWEGCPYAYRASFTGKEGYPTLGFNVTVDHDMRVLHVCSMFAGRFNDKTKVLYDTYVKRLREGFYDGFSFNLRDSEGVETTHHDNPYLICDGGYHKWLQLMCGFKTTNVEALALWSKKLESIKIFYVFYSR